MSLSIKNWSEADRPREKMLAKGQQALTDAELLAVLIGSGSRNESAVDLSKKILASAQNNLHELGKLTVNQLQQQKGIGQAKAVTIMAALELGRRRKASDIMQRRKIDGSHDAAEIFLAVLADLPHEECWAMYLNQANLMIEYRKLSSGTINASLLDIRLLVKQALDLNAVNVIISHNHPSGNLQPSADDIKLTKQIQQALRLFDIQLSDHLIVSHNAYFSFYDHELLAPPTKHGFDNY